MTASTSDGDAEGAYWDEVDWSGSSNCDVFFDQAKVDRSRGVGRDAVLLPTRNISVSRTPQSGGNIVHAYQDALEYADGSLALMGFPLLGAMMTATPFIFVAAIGDLPYMLHGAFSSPSRSFGSILGLITVLLIFVMLRMDLTGYRYSPTMFDRRQGKVHVFSDTTSFLGLWPLWGGRRKRVDSYDWSCVRAEVRPFKVRSSNYTQNLAALHCIVLAGPKDTHVVAQFPMGFTSDRDAVQLLLNRWEHIRRFMEERGPQFTDDDKPQTWIDHLSLARALATGQPLFVEAGGPAAHSWWSIFMLLCLPITACFGLIRWVVFHVKGAPKWPPAIREGLGAPLTAKHAR